MQSIKSRISPYITAAKAVYEIQKRGEPRTGISIKKVRRLPAMSCGYWYATIEGCLFANCSRELERAVKNVFDTFDEETKYRLTLAPKYRKKEWVERAALWREKLQCLPTKQYYLAMSYIIQHYIRCVRNRR